MAFLGLDRNSMNTSVVINFIALIIASLLIYLSTKDNNQDNEVHKVKNITVSRALNMGNIGKSHLESKGILLDYNQGGFVNIPIGTQPAHTIISQIGMIVSTNTVFQSGVHFSVGTTAGTAAAAGANDLIADTELAVGGISNYHSGNKYLLYNSSTFSGNNDNELKKAINQRKPDVGTADDQADRTEALQIATNAKFGTGADRELHLKFNDAGATTDAQIRPPVEVKIFVTLTHVPNIA